MQLEFNTTWELSKLAVYFHLKWDDEEQVHGNLTVCIVLLNYSTKVDEKVASCSWFLHTFKIGNKQNRENDDDDDES